MDQNIMVALGISLGLLIVLRVGFGQWEKLKRAFFAPIHKDKPLIQHLEPIAFNITVDQLYLNFRPNRSHRTYGRIIIQPQAVQISCTAGILIRAKKTTELQIKALGGKRLIILGKNPNKETAIRIELTHENDAELVSHITEALQE